MKLWAFLIFLSFESAFASSQFGLFMVVKGDVKIIKSDKKESVAKVGSKIEEGETVLTGADSRAKIVMSDRNVIYVSPDTKMEITKYVNDNKSGVKGVELKLDQGRIRNNVEQIYDGNKNKFEVKTPTAVAGVRGTQFVTSYDRKTQSTRVVTIVGQVNFTSLLNGRPVGATMEVKKEETSSVGGAGVPAETPQTMPKNEIQEIDRSSISANKPPANESAATDEGNSRSPASVGGANTGTSMIDKTDMSPDMAKDIQPRAGAAPPPTSVLVRPPALQQLIQNPLVRDVIRENNGKAKIIIRPR